MDRISSNRPFSRRISSELGGEGGFTIVEVMVAAVLLIVGLLGTVTMIDNANSTTWSTKAREQAVSLQRELIESARSVSYDQLTPARVGALLRAKGGLGDSSLGDPAWTIRRRGFTYAVAVGVCAVDDVRDGTGTHDGAVFCATGSGSAVDPPCDALLGGSGSISGAPAAAAGGASVGECGIDLNRDGTVDNLTEASVGMCSGICAGAGTDRTPSDYKRLIVLVRWDRGKGRRYALQSSTVPNPGLAIAPTVTNLSTTAEVPVVTAAGFAVPFTATVTRSPATVAWYVDGTQKGTASGSGSTWAFDWPLGNLSVSGTPGPDEVLDGSYLIGAKAYDQYGQFGTTRALTVTVNRRRPFPVTGAYGGRNGTGVEFEWIPSKERDVQGYRVYRGTFSTTTSPVLVCGLTLETSCRDDSPPPGALLAYEVVAVDKDPSGALRDGEGTGPINVAENNRPPNPPTNLGASSFNGNTVLLWRAPTVEDPDSGDRIAFYRIYRDGSGYADRYDRTSDGSVLNFTDSQTGGRQHTYRITAVDTQLAESTILGPVTR